MTLFGLSFQLQEYMCLDGLALFWRHINAKVLGSFYNPDFGFSHFVGFPIFGTFLRYFFSMECSEKKMIFFFIKKKML